MTTSPGSLVDRMLTAFLLLAPLLSLAADTLYALRGWSDPTAAVLHVLGATAYAFAVLRLVTWLPARSGWAAALLLTGVVGAAGNVAYGFNTIHVSLGDTDLVDASGAAVLIKPLGLFFPLALLVAGLALAAAGVGARWCAGLLMVVALLWPIAHIGNIGWLAVAVNLAVLGVAGALVLLPTASATPTVEVPQALRR